MGLHGSLGALLFGAALSGMPYQVRRDIAPGMRSAAEGLFVPLFFAAAGLHLSLSFTELPGLTIAALVLVPLVGKFAGALIGALVARLDTPFALATGLMAKGVRRESLIVGEFLAGGIIGVVLDTTDGLDLCYQLVEGANQCGKAMDIGGIPFFRYFYVAETEEQARRDSEAALNWTMDVNQWRRTYQRGSEVYDNLDDFLRTRTELPPSFDYLFEHRAFIGNPEQIVAKIRALQDAGIGYFGCNFSFGGMPQDKVLKSMELFAREVMPEFA